MWITRITIYNIVIVDSEYFISRRSSKLVLKRSKIIDLFVVIVDRLPVLSSVVCGWMLGDNQRRPRVPNNFIL